MVIATETKDGRITCPVCEVAGRGKTECKALVSGRYWCPMCDEVMLHPICNPNCDLVISDGVSCDECQEAKDNEIDKRIMAERGQ